MITPALLDTLARLLSLPREQCTVEFKSNLADKDEIGQYLSALANAAALEGHERAWLLWGVADGSHAVTGTSFDPLGAKVGGNQSLVMWLQQMTQPRADFQFHEVAHPQGRVVMLEIHPARSAPVAFQQVRYIRVDSHKTRLGEHPDKEARLWARLGVKEDWSGVVVPEATLDDLDPEALAAARQRFAEYRLRSEPDADRHEAIRAETEGWSDETLLNKARITKQGRITRAALLLLGRDEAAHFLSPADAKISWIPRDASNATLTSQHFGPPFLLATEKAFARVRNLTLDHMPDGTLFPTPVPRYDSWVMREALHNAVAHQDYALGGKINLVEHPDRLVLSNLGQFIPESVEWMLEHQSPPEHYRNQWLIDGMIRLRMIDQAGSGIRRMFTTQRQRLFPLPDYLFDTTPQGLPRVELTLQGQVLDVNFARALMARSDLNLGQVLLLDRVQKGRSLAPDQARALRELGLIEGRAPRHFISAKVAEVAGQKARYIHNRGLDDGYYQRLVVDYLRRYGHATRSDLDALLLAKLPDVLSPTQKANKVKNLLQAMRLAGLVHRHGPRGQGDWRLGTGPESAV
ncbi:putative DNA binding domain-containing protein [Ideonella sp. 4Y16]|uniref:RNA-binding domain-containing protein n=1 Tax=Ideonella alba TaxID=2824118 RepID=UPI001B37C246|nr:RNA-binding domain-containing protein [Ideonella alba]MBQ0945712.1 putative DNA binding domain-containing protein [Ideonella alba]